MQGGKNIYPYGSISMVVSKYKEINDCGLKQFIETFI